MKLNNHISKEFLYIPIMETDGLKLIELFEDFDETFINYNLNSKKKKLNFFLDTEDMVNLKDFNILDKGKEKS